MMARSKRPLCLNTEDGKFLGVCAGIADYLDVEPWAIRLIFIVSVFLGGWFFVPLYFIAWLLMGKQRSGEDLARSFNERPIIRHFRNVDYKKGLYRNSRDGRVLGVCAGIADYLEVEVFWVRLITFGVMILTGFFALIAYVGAWMILNDRPRQRHVAANIEHSKYQDTLDETRTSSRTGFKSCSRKYSALQARLTKMEAYVTSSRFRLHRAFQDIE